MEVETQTVDSGEVMSHDNDSDLLTRLKEDLRAKELALKETEIRLEKAEMRVRDLELRLGEELTQPGGSESRYLILLI